MKILQKAAKDLGCEFHKGTMEHSVDLANTTREKVKEWLKNNGFEESAVRHGRWMKGQIWLQFDDMSVINCFQWGRNPR